MIRSFNQDKPYNVFLKEQIAGDELDTKTDDTLIATGFLRAGPRVAFREKDNPERRYEYLDDLIATTGRGLLGLTVQRAEDVEEAVRIAWQHDGSVVIDFRVEREVNVFPMVPQGKSIGEMLVSEEVSA